MPHRNARILYIDDDPGLCRLVQKEMQRRGYSVEIALDGASGVARIAQGGIDIVALDHYMPSQDGLETLACIRNLPHPPPVIYVTATQDGQVAIAALKAGAVDYVAKDANGEFPALLQRAIEAALDAVLLRRAKEAAEAESKLNWQLAQCIVDSIRDPLVVLEQDMTIVTANKAFLTIFGIVEAEVRGRRFAELGQRQWDVPALRYLMDKVLPEDKPIESFEIEDVFPGLGLRVFNLNARKISRPETHTHRMLLVFEDITDRKQRERDALMLTNEISHRIKNNLQLIVGLLACEARSTAQPYAQGYHAMQARIGAIAQLYDLISQSSHGQNVAVDDYLREIAHNMSTSLLGGVTGIKIQVEADELSIDPDRAVPFGLLVNELATNAIKHAFPHGTGTIVLRARRDGEEIELSVSDDGVGIKDKDSAPMPETRGWDYVAIFVRQLGGTIIPPESGKTGTTVRIRLPPRPAAPTNPGRGAA